MTVNPQQDQSANAEQKTEKELNFERLRKQLEQERTARAQAEEKARFLEQERQSMTKKQPVLEEEDDSSEPYVDHKHLNKKFNKWEERIAETIDKKAEEKARILLEQEKQREFYKKNPDFQQVMSQENIEKYGNSDPEETEDWLELPNSFARQKVLYRQIKKAQKQSAETPKQSIQDTIEKNRKSPYYQPSGMGSAPYATTGDFSPQGQKNAYDKLQELKAKLRI